MTLNIPAATATQETRVDFSAKAKGSLRRYYPTDPDSYARYSTAICVVFDGTTPCATHDVPAWATQADLPAPVGVHQGTVVTYAADLTGTQSQASFGQKVTGHTVVQGASALTESRPVFQNF